MKGTNLGEFEELLLLVVASLLPAAYGVAIREEIKNSTGRAVAMGAVHAALNRLEEKSFLKSELASATHARGGRRKRLFTLTVAGKEALQISRELRNNLWDKIPQLTWDKTDYAGI
jgi:DNA-binding PadR family transcriptional regulator